MWSNTHVHLSQALLAFSLLLPSHISFAYAATAINLGAAGRYAVLGRFGTTVGALAQINGDIGVSPSLSTTLVGFGLVPADGYATSALVNGRIYAPDYASSPAGLDQAALDVLDAWKSAMDQPVPPSDESKRNLGAGVLSGMTLTPGVYNFGSAITWSTDITLVGGAEDVFLFQATGAISCAASVKVILSGGVQPKNVVWASTGAFSTGASAVFQGIAISNAAVTVGASSVVNGRLYAQGAMTMGAGVILTGPPAPVVVVSSAIATAGPPITVTVTRPTTVRETVLATQITTRTISPSGTTRTSVVTLFGATVSKTAYVTSTKPTTYYTTLPGIRTTQTQTRTATTTQTRTVPSIVVWKSFVYLTRPATVFRPSPTTVVWRTFVYRTHYVPTTIVSKSLVIWRQFSTRTVVSLKTQTITVAASSPRMTSPPATTAVQTTLATKSKTATGMRRRRPEYRRERE
uniref:Antifreeze protein n=1 Tax=Glaciozyma antarctica TaxID=105987 RepID=M1K417_9BASI|nr:antifreeze protein [Glaciozyma antarctica]